MSAQPTPTEDHMANPESRKNQASVSTSSANPMRMHPWDFVHITPGPTKVLKREFGGNRWCFKCRKRHDHQATLLDYEEPSYYEPIWVLACGGCGEDHTGFPQ